MNIWRIRANTYARETVEDDDRESIPDDDDLLLEFDERIVAPTAEAAIADARAREFGKTWKETDDKQDGGTTHEYTIIAFELDSVSNEGTVDRVIMPVEV